MSAGALSYLECSELAEIMSSSAPFQTHLVVDVRDEDFAGGNIRDALNLCSEQFEQEEVMHGLLERGMYVSVCAVCG